MKFTRRIGLVLLSLALGVAAPSGRAGIFGGDKKKEGNDAALHAAGSFEATVKTEDGDPNLEDVLSRMAIDKVFHGDLEGTGSGEMLAYRTKFKGSASYVAIERVIGTLGGKSGSFMLQHSGTLSQGVSSLSVIVVPDSGTDQLLGLSGQMTVSVVQGVHHYEFDYTLPHKGP